MWNHSKIPTLGPILFSQKSAIPDPAFQLEKFSLLGFSSPSSPRRLDLNQVEKNQNFLRTGKVKIGWRREKSSLDFLPTKDSWGEVGIYLGNHFNPLFFPPLISPPTASQN